MHTNFATTLAPLDNTLSRVQFTQRINFDLSALFRRMKFLPVYSQERCDVTHRISTITLNNPSIRFTFSRLLDEISITVFYLMTIISQFEIFLNILVRFEKTFIRKLGKFNTSSHITEKYLHLYRCKWQRAIPSDTI